MQEKFGVRHLAPLTVEVTVGIARKHTDDTWGRGLRGMEDVGSGGVAEGLKPSSEAGRVGFWVEQNNLSNLKLKFV